MRYSILLSYDGTAFSGWQIQPNAESVQEHLRKALSVLLKENIEVTGAGRTDAGVHAVNYIAHFDSATVLTAGALSHKLNAILPAGIRVHSIENVHDGFHARFDACEREYTYFLHRRRDPFMRSYSYQCSYPLDIGKMNRAAAHLLGTHDFRCFEKTGGGSKGSICTVTYAGWESYTPDHVRILGYPCEEGDYLFFRIRANRFLRNMVRAVVGSLIAVGRGRHDEEWIAELIDHGTRCDAGESVPGNGLFLNKVSYPRSCNDNK